MIGWEERHILKFLRLMERTVEELDGIKKELHEINASKEPESERDSGEDNLSIKRETTD